MGRCPRLQGLALRTCGSALPSAGAQAGGGTWTRKKAGAPPLVGDGSRLALAPREEEPRRVSYGGKETDGYYLVMPDAARQGLELVKSL